jgi:hypothetical protein
VNRDHELTPEEMASISADLWNEIAALPSWDGQCLHAEDTARAHHHALSRRLDADHAWVLDDLDSILATTEARADREGSTPALWEYAITTMDTTVTAALAAPPRDLTDHVARLLCPRTTWSPVDLAAVLAGDLAAPTPTVLEVDTTPRRHLFYARAVNGIHGDSGIGKSWVATVAMAQELAKGNRVMLIDYEDTPQTLCARLLSLLVPTDRITTLVDYRRPHDYATDEAVTELVAAITGDNITLVVVDSLGEAFGLQGIDENADKEVAPFIRNVIRPLADAGAAVVVIDHSTKAKDNPLHPSGSKRKRAAFTGASYLVSSERPPVKAEGADPVEGRLTLTCAKDRHGTYRQGSKVANVVLTSFPDGAVTAHLYSATADDVSAQEKTRLALTETRG